MAAPSLQYRQVSSLCWVSASCTGPTGIKVGHGQSGTRDPVGCHIGDIAIVVLAGCPASGSHKNDGVTAGIAAVGHIGYANTEGMIGSGRAGQGSLGRNGVVSVERII